MLFNVYILYSSLSACELVSCRDTAFNSKTKRFFALCPTVVLDF